MQEENWFIKNFFELETWTLAIFTEEQKSVAFWMWFCFLNNLLKLLTFGYIINNLLGWIAPTTTTTTATTTAQKWLLWALWKFGFFFSQSQLSALQKVKVRSQKFSILFSWDFFASLWPLCFIATFIYCQGNFLYWKALTNLVCRTQSSLRTWLYIIIK